MMRLFGAAALAALSTLALPAEAESAEYRHAPLPGHDGVYGRLDGSLDLELAAGLALEAGQPRGVLRASGHYLWTAGAYLRYEDAFGRHDERPLRALGFGVDLRPLFLPRFALDAEQGPAWLDLTLDSLSLSAGAYFAEPQSDSFGDERGFDLGLGAGMPLLGTAAGPWFSARAERRFADEEASAWLFTFTLSYRAPLLSTEGPR